MLHSTSFPNLFVFSSSLSKKRNFLNSSSKTTNASLKFFDKVEHQHSNRILKTEQRNYFPLDQQISKMDHLHLKSGQNNFVGDFFPHKKAFMHYWILPFVGFVGYCFLTPNQFNSKQQSSFLSNKISNFTEHLSNNSLFKFENNIISKQNYSISQKQLKELEKNEMKYLWQSLFLKYKIWFILIIQMKIKRKICYFKKK